MTDKLFGMACNAMRTSREIRKGSKAYLMSISKQGSNPALVHVYSNGILARDLLSNYKNFRVSILPFEALDSARRGGVPSIFPLHTSRKYEGFKQVLNFIKQEANNKGVTHGNKKEESASE